MSDTAVWFDLDGTLLAVDDYGKILERACGAVGLEGETRTDFVAAYQETFLDQFQALEPEPYADAARAGADAAGVDVDPATFADELLAAECAGTRVPTAVRECLERLGDDHPVGVLTNGVTDWQTEKLAHHDLREPLDAVVVSQAAGAHKPRVAPFEAAEAVVAADEHWMVGDDREADVDGARTAGWHGVHVAGPQAVPEAVEEL